ncbi:aminoglycoside adenylyltransferase domain-containing protein [Treponema phagedenis]|uniref:Acetyltransferase n=1 Tax=Treponema phagedenis TaxID=162 RepID=A0A0B7H399_TREPH|nr:aminoglycoside adenylyltransferase domain-containing protein [Treponema phagedenis]NVP22909.1 DUF4111 domain-containing protein [Treponema phagedenis]QEJ94982.1 DUF4111 domain-containing protein [Treponema phagedenis]QEK00885.1 DUF4111 domain-containing protein [Treponema phagedenis]QEK05893.1 DUF4111 domain-containing protein [Treponema phagedenis]QKS92258.1 DUF4111 domain-containing protein [Treponema phagedenis]
MILSEIKNLLKDFVEHSKKILKDNLVGVYLHGSLVMECFNPEKSDIDLIVVINQPLLNSVKREYMDMVVKCNDLAPAKGIEMSIVLRGVCNPFAYPTPFELHFSSMHLKWYKDNPEEYIRKMNGEDIDLAAHFTILNKRGSCLYGAPIKSVFAEVPNSNYMDSICNDISDAKENIEKDTMYLVLNLARVLAYKEDGLILSKKECVEWAIKKLPKEYHKLIEDAMREYTENIKIMYDIVLAKRYAKYAIMRIQQGINSTNPSL